MNVTQKIARTVLALVLALGLAHGLLALSSATGLARPFVVVSGSMEPEIQTGALLITVPRATRDLSIGQVVTVYSPLTHNTVTHRLVDIQVLNGQTVATLKGDNNTYADPQQYILGDTTWVPTVNIPFVGRIMGALSQPLVLMGLGVGVVAVLLLGIRAKPQRTTGRHRRLDSVQIA